MHRAAPTRRHDKRGRTKVDENNLGHERRATTATTGKTEVREGEQALARAKRGRVIEMREQGTDLYFARDNCCCLNHVCCILRRKWEKPLLRRFRVLYALRELLHQVSRVASESKSL
jgi:hypothetical protein